MRKTKLVTMLLALSMSAMLASGCQLPGLSESSSDSITSEQPSSASTSVGESSELSVTLDQTEASVGLFDTLTLKATVTGSNASATFRSSDESVATVSSNGVVTPQKVGSVTITATVSGESASCNVTVSAPTGAIEVTVPYETLNLETGKTTKLVPAGYLGAKELSGGIYSYSSDDPQVVTVAEDGTITAVGAGSTTVRINGTFKGVAGQEVALTVTVTDPKTHDVETIAGKAVYYANREEKLSLDLSAYNYTTIESVYVGDTQVTFSTEGKTLNIAKESLGSVTGGDQEILINGLTATGDILINAQMLYVNYAIGSVDEFNAFGAACNVGGTARTPYLYVVVTDDFDYNGANFCEYYAGGYFYGYFDGQGHTINNIKVVNSVFQGIYGLDSEKISIVKNIAFTNVLKDTPNGGGLFANDVGNAIVENCYVSGKVTQYTGTYCGGFAASISTAGTQIKNCLVNAEFYAKPFNMYANVCGGTLENCYAISATGTGLTANAGTSEGVYKTVKEFKNAVKELPSGFNANYWEIKEGMLVFKSALQYAGTPSVTLTAKNEGSDAVIGTSLAFEVDNAGAAIEIVGENTTGITLNGTSVSIGENATPGATFKVVASTSDPISGVEAASESVEYTVVSAENVTIEGVRKVAKNRNESLTFDFTNTNATSIQSVTIGSELVDAANYTYENGVITIAANAVQASGDQAVAIVGLKENGYVFVSANVQLIDFAIGTADELTAFAEYFAIDEGRTPVVPAADPSTRTPYTYVVLTDNIDYGGANFSAKSGNNYFYGVFDGQGHTINNIKAVNAIFPGVYGMNASEKATIKNVAFTNVLRDTANGGALLANDFNNAIIDNVYVQGMATAYTGGLFGGLVGSLNSGGEIRNSFVLMEVTSAPGKYDAICGAYNNGKVENCYALSTTSSGEMYDGNTTNLYTTAEAFKAAVTAVPEGFDADLWTIEDGMLVFKSALKYAVKEAKVEFVGEETEIVRGSSIEFTATAGVTVKVVGESTEGITISDNTVIVSATVAGGTKFKLSATVTDVFTGKTYTAESRELTVVVSEEVTLEGAQTVAKNRNEKLTLDLSAYDITELSSVMVGMTAIDLANVTTENGVLTIEASALPGGVDMDVTVVAKTANGTLTAMTKLSVYDYAIGTKAEWDAFGAACNVGGATRTPYTYVILTDNIDYQGGFFTDSYSGGYFNGYIDGQGYTVSNITVRHSVFPGLYGVNATTPRVVVKNIAFINVEKTTANGGGLFANEIGFADISNVYVSGKISVYAGTTTGGLCGRLLESSTVKNCVVVAEFNSKPDSCGALGEASAKGTTVENVYAISSNSKGGLFNSEEGTITSSKLYTTYDAFKAEIAAVPAGFDADLWAIEDGMLVFKSALKFSVLTLTAEKDFTEVVGGSSLTFKVGHPNATLSVTVEGITVSGTTVTIGADVAEGTKFKVVATAFDTVTGKTFTAESAEYTVTKPQSATLEGEAMAAKNRAGSLEYDLSAYKATEIISVTVGGNNINYTFADNKLSVATSEIAASGHLDVTVIAENAEGYLAIATKAYVVDFAIGTKAELEAFAEYYAIDEGRTTVAATSTRTPYTYVVLTDNIDYGGDNFSAKSGDNYFYGYFDGQGYTINNIKAVNAIFPGVYGVNASEKATIKNVAFTNVLRDTPNGGAFLANDFNNAIIDNVYVQGQVTTYTGGLFGGLVGSLNPDGEIRNSLVLMEVTSAPGKYDAICGAYNNGKVENCYALSTTSSGEMYNGNTTNLYTTADAFKAAVTAVPAGFDANIWTIGADGMLVFKSSVKTASGEA